MKHQTHPFVSIVVVTFNRSTLLDPCLQSVQNQTYPDDRYEIIVVDDASTDDTGAVVRRHRGVRYILHETNRGIPAARNTGLAAARGEIIAYIDDDAAADPSWLEHLVEPFDDAKVTASGGLTFAYKTEYFAERYLSAVGYGNPAPIGFGMSKNPLWRFFIYIKNMFRHGVVASVPTEVQAVYGLNCAFRTPVIRAEGGFDETLMADEDSEICTRLRLHGARIMFIPTATIRHRHREKFSYLVRQTYRRSQYTVPYYAKEKKIPPIFPLPFLYLAIAIPLVIFHPLIGITFVALGPLVLYSWWPIRALQRSNIEYITYGHAQMLLESAALLGMVRGKINAHQ